MVVCICVCEAVQSFALAHRLECGYTVFLYSNFDIMNREGFKPGLTREQLHDIGVRRDPADIIPLLWEIKRLRAIVTRANQLQASLYDGVGGGAGLILQCLREELAGEPVIEEIA